MKRIVIISTYPTEGSKNIGDYLITQSVDNAIAKISRDTPFVTEIVWRADTWANVSEKILQCDFIIFACFAIRQNIQKAYTYLDELLDLNIPIGVIAAGTALENNTVNGDIYNCFNKEDISILKELGEKACFFTTRDVLSQGFCEYHCIPNVKFSGDIAFYSETINKFTVNERKIKKIAISDPHYALNFKDSFILLYSEIKKHYKNAEITVLLHGVNPIIESLCNNMNIKYIKIYEVKENGLEIYQEFDLHIGYRVHGHVSALKSGIPSYLLEQDGRGTGYGLTLNCKCSVNSNYINHTNIGKTLPDKLLRRIIKEPRYIRKKMVPLSPITKIVDMVKNDQINNFSKFIILNDQIDSFNVNNLKTLNEIFK